MQLTVGQNYRQALKAYGVPYVAGLPGHGNWSLIDAFNDSVSKLPQYCRRAADGIEFVWRPIGTMLKSPSSVIRVFSSEDVTKSSD